MKKTLKKLMKIIIIIFFACTFVLWLYKSIFYPRKYKEIVEQAASIYRVDPNLVYAVIKQESKFNSNAISKSGAKGLMQIMDATAKDMVNNINGINSNNYNIYDPYTNIFIGTKYLSYLIRHFDGNYYLAIIAYNAGMGQVDNWTNKTYNKYSDFNDVYSCIKYAETRNYLTQITSNYDYYTKLYN